MTDEPIKDREDAAEKGLDDQPSTDQPSSEPSPDEPWAKTSSGDKDKMAPEDDE
jgi:hypothetical protein